MCKLCKRVLNLYFKCWNKIFKNTILEIPKYVELSTCVVREDKDIEELVIPLDNIRNITK